MGGREAAKAKLTRAQKREKHRWGRGPLKSSKKLAPKLLSKSGIKMP